MAYANSLKNMFPGLPVKVISSGSGFNASSIGYKTTIQEKGNYYGEIVGYKIDCSSLLEFNSEAKCNGITGSHGGFHGYDSFKVDLDAINNKPGSIKLKSGNTFFVSKPLQHWTVEQCLAEISLNRERFISRGGIYAW